MSPVSLTETDSKNLLQAVGIPVSAGRDVAGVEHAVAAAEALGFPVVLKVSHPELAHKSDYGGVVLDVQSADRVAASVPALLALADGARVRVEQQASAGLDLICGARRDPVFGPVVMVGMGGIFAEVLQDTALHVGGLDRATGLALLGQLQGRALLAGARGTEPVSREAIADVLVALGRLLHERPDIVELDINPLRAYPDSVLALDGLVVTDSLPVESAGTHPATSLEPLFAPRSVAVVGASRKARRAGNIIIDNMLTLGYQGAIYPVNPGGGTIAGLSVYPSLAACPEPPETVVLAVPYQQVERVMDDLFEAGIGHVIVVSGGFGDAGPEGRRREAALVARCREHGVRLMGPNSIGTLDTRSGFTTSIGTLPAIRPSGISVLGQTGTLSTGFALEGETVHQVGFARIACLGNKADVDESDFLTALGRHEETRVIGAYLESVGDGTRFLAAAREAVRRKPVVVLKSGRTALGAAAAASHTGALAAEDRVFDAVFRQTGLQRVDSLPELLATLRTFDLCPLPAGPRLGIVSLTGVGCVLAADACGPAGLELALLSDETGQALRSVVPEWAPLGNPADIWSTIEQLGPQESFRRFVEAFLADAQVDMVLVITVLLEEGAFDMGAMLAPLRTAYPGKPLLAAYVGARKDLLEDLASGLAAAQVPLFDSPAAAVQAAGRLWQRRRFELEQRQDG